MGFSPCRNWARSGAARPDKWNIFPMRNVRRARSVLEYGME